MKVSIITPIHNAESTIAETAESVMRQDNVNWEWLFFEDASTDKSLQILEQLQKKDSRLRIIGQSEKSMGPSYGRNRCIEESKGDLIAFLDADDLWLPEYLNKRIETHSAFPEVGMICGPAIYFGSGQENVQDTGFIDSKLFKPSELILPFMTNIKGTPCPSGATIKKEVFERGIAFPKELRRGEDIAFFLLVNQHFAVFYDAAPIFKYRRHADSSTLRAVKSGDFYEMELAFYKWLLEFSRNSGSTQIERMGGKIYYRQAGTTFTEMQLGYIKSRKNLYRRLTEGKLPRFFKLFFLLDCLLPIKFSKRIRNRIFMIFDY